MAKDLRPKSVEAYVDLIDQALFEIEDLRAAAEYDEDSMGGALAFLGDLEGQVNGIKQQMLQGNYRFQDRDLPYMKTLETIDDRLLPFKHLLHLINATHRNGLNTEEEQAP